MSDLLGNQDDLTNINELPIPAPHRSRAQIAADARGREHLEALARDASSIEEWFAAYAKPHIEVLRAAQLVRSRAQELVLDPSGQDSHRRELEVALGASMGKLEAENKDFASDRASDVAKDLETKFRWYYRGHYWSEEDEDVLEDSSSWPEIQQARADILAAIATRVGIHRGLQEEARDATDCAHQTVTEALRRSRTTFRRRRVRRLRSSVFAAAPLGAFLLVAGFGIAAAPTTGWVWLAIGALVGSTGIAAIAGLRRGKKATAGDMVLLGAGSSLAIFTALYLLSAFHDPTSIGPSDSLHSIQSISEAALLSLSVGGTVGPIGIDLRGVARAVAFVQLLFMGLGKAD